MYGMEVSCPSIHVWDTRFEIHRELSTYSNGQSCIVIIYQLPLNRVGIEIWYVRKSSIALVTIDTPELK